MEEDIQKHLHKHNIQYEHFTHKALYTSKDSDEVSKTLPGVHCKNLFLKEKNGKHYYLITLPVKKSADLHKLQQELGIKKLTFCSEKELTTILHTQPGHVSPFGLLYDTNRAAEYIIDADVWDATGANFHPAINTETVYLPQQELHKLIESFAHAYRVILL